jgi:glyoxylate/hydroxypyruvate reductase A
MAEYVLLHVLRFHRRLPEVEAAHQARQWTQFLAPLASEVTVGLMGVGNLGGFVAQKLLGLGYNVVGWSRRRKDIPRVQSFAGPDELPRFLASATILVCLLPQTPATESILDKSAFAAMPAGSCLINVGRGECLVERDLLNALDSGHLRGAALDVFRAEPLAADSPLWAHPGVLVTCHSAGVIDPAIGGTIIAANIRAHMSGERVTDIVDIEQGY